MTNLISVLPSNDFNEEAQKMVEEALDTIREKWETRGLSGDALAQKLEEIKSGLVSDISINIFRKARECVERSCKLAVNRQDGFLEEK